MKPAIVFGLLCCGSLWSHGDRISGPSRTTIQNLSWGTLFFEPAKEGACQLEPTTEGYRFTSSAGEVTIKGSEFNGYQLAWGKELLKISHLNGGAGLDIQKDDRRWSLRTDNGNLTLTASFPKEVVVFTRSSNTFTIKGAKGSVIVTTEWGNLRVQSPLGTTTVTNQNGKRTFTGPALDQIPYLGRGFFLPFHGVGLFVDITRYFPMPEVAEWADWKPILDL